MIGKDIDLTRRRVLFTIVAIGLASAAAGAGTMAFFSDTETSSNNNVTAGTLDLGSATMSDLNITNAVPGDSKSGNMSAEYSGSVDAEIDVNVSVSEPDEPDEPASNDDELDATEFASNINVTSAEAGVGGTTEELATTAHVTDANGDGAITLDEFVASAPFDSVVGENAIDGETVWLDLSLEFWEEAGNDAQADGVNITVSLIAEQPEADS